MADAVITQEEKTEVQPTSVQTPAKESQTDNNAASQETQTQNTSSSNSQITADSIKEIEDNEQFFPICSACIKNYRADNKKQDELKKFLENYPNEKTMFIIKTNEQLTPVRDALGGEIKATDLNSFIEEVKANPEALNALNAFIKGEDVEKAASEGEEEISDEDPWISSALGRLRSKNLF